MKKTYIVTDAGPGDGGKGEVVHKISTMTKAHTIIKDGGGQGSHGIETIDGLRFAFSHWGCGTFEGVKTHISTRLVTSIEGIMNEAEALRYTCGIHDPFELLTIDEQVICATPYHGIASRLKEMALGKNPRGTIGTGIGEAYRDSERLPELIIRVKDLKNNDLIKKIKAVRDQQISDLAELVKHDFLKEDRSLIKKETDLLYDEGFLDYIVNRFKKAGKKLNIVDPEYLKQRILSLDGTVVIEKLLPGSHKQENRYQGKIRVGPLDLVLLRYAIKCCGGPDKFDGLAITWFDQIQNNGAWHICDRYSNAQDPNYFTSGGELKVRPGDDDRQLLHQENLGQKLLKCIPQIDTIKIDPKANHDQLFELCNQVLKQKLGIPVRMVSFGTTEKNKLCK